MKITITDESDCVFATMDVEVNDARNMSRIETLIREMLLEELEVVDCEACGKFIAIDSTIEIEENFIVGRLCKDCG